MRKVLRVLGIVAGCAAVAVVVARLGFGLYLESGHAKRLASEQLSALFGGTVRVTDLEAGVGSTAVQVEVMAPPVDGQTAPQPIVTGTVKANVSPIELAAGDRPTAVSLVNAQVTLRFDKDGNLLTKLPEPQGGSGGKLPTITVKGASIHLVQEGRPDFRASGIDVSVTDDGQSLKIAGKAADPTWKAWTLSGEWSKSGGKGSIVLRTDDRVAVNPAMLKAVPFVPAETWDWVVLTGNTTCAVHVIRRPDKTVGYRVELDPQDTRLTVPPIDLTTTETSGKVVVEDQVVTLTDVKGKTAGGTLRVDSKLDFASTPSVLTFDVKARGLNIPLLPKDWGLPPLDAGRLEGGADLKLVVKGGKVEPWGRGEADIVGGKLLGGTVEGKITLVGDGERFRFQRQLAAAPPLSFPPPLGGRDRVGGETSYRFEAFPPTPALPPKGGGRKKELILKGGGYGTDLAVALLSLMLQSPTSADPAAQSETTYIQANLRLKDIDLAELVRRLEVKLPIRITGRASLDIAAEIPVAQARTLRAYRIKGSLTVPTLGLEDLTLNRVTADIVFRDGVLTLTNLSGEVPRPGSPPGTFVGTARYGVDPQTDLTADLKLASIPLAEVFKALPELAGTASGLVSGSAKLTAPGDKLGDVTAYVADGTLTALGLTAFGRRAERVSLKLALREGVARITDAAAVVEGLPLTGSASVTLAGKYPYSATIKTAPADVANIKRLIPEAGLPFELTGKLETSTKLSGTLSPVAFAASGTATATGLTLGTVKVEKVTADWTVDDKALTLRNVRSDLYEGTITGSAKFPLKETEAGEFNVTFAKLDAAAVTRAVPSTPVRLEGAISGTLHGTLPPARKGDVQRATATLNLTSPRLRVQGVPAERLKGKVDVKPGGIAYDLTGETLGGSFDVSGMYPFAQEKKEPPRDREPVSGRIRLRGLQLARLADALGVPALGPLRGTVNLTVSYGHGEPAGGGRLEVIDLGWGESGVGQDVRAVIRVTPTTVEIPELSGWFADGTLRGRLRYDLANPERSFYTLTLDGADAGRLLVPFGFDALGARVTVSTRGGLGSRPHGTGTVSFHRGKVSGFQLAEVRVPFGWSYTPGIGGRLSVRDAGGQLLGGRVTGEATVAWGTSAHVQGRLKFVSLSFRALLGRFGQSSGLGSGPMNGQFTFSGSEMRSLDDLTGQVVATIGEGPVYDLPVFSQFAQYVVPSVSGRGLVRFNRGELRGRLAKGQFRIERLGLTGPESRLFVDGTVGVRTGRLDLDVVAATGQVGLNAGLLRSYAVRVLAAGSVPVQVALEVSRLLSNRTVRARVTGTIDRPVVTVNVAGLLTGAAVQFFLEPYLSLPR